MEPRRTPSLSAASLKRRLLSGGAWAMGGKLGAVAIALLSNVLLARLLSPADFGTYLLIVSTVSMASVLACLGLNNTTVRFVAESMGLGRHARTRRAVSMVVGLGMLGALAVGLAYYAGAGRLLSEIFGVPALAAFAGLIGGWILISTAQELFAETFRGFHDVRLATLLGSMTVGSSAGLTMRVLFLACLLGLWFTGTEMSLTIIMLVILGSGSITTLLAGFLLRARTTSLDNVPDEDPEIRLGEVLGASLPLLVNNLVLFVLVQADLWIIAAFRPPEEVAIYGAASRLMMLVTMPLMVVNAVLPPVIAELYARGEKDRLEGTIRPVATATLVPALLSLGLFAVAGGPIMGLLYGDFYAAGAGVLTLLSLGKLASVWAGSCGLTLQMTGGGGLLMGISILSGAVFVAAALLLVRDFGAVGVAGAAAASIALQNLLAVLAARAKTGIWTHAAFSVAPVRKLWMNFANGR